MRRNPDESREVILGAAESFTKERGVGAMTVEGVARAAGCAKGLVHYHFKTKSRLIHSVADRLASYRQARWKEAFDAPSPEDAIDRTWSVLTDESSDGTLRAWTSLLLSESGLTDSTVKEIDERFSTALRDAALGMLDASGLVPSVPPEEIGWYLGSVIHGMGFHLLSGMSPRELEGAYAAAWAGVLSLTRAGGATAGADRAGLTPAARHGASA